MTRKISVALVAAVLLAGSPGLAYAKHGADDTHPEPVGVRLAKHGADDTHPEPVGVRLAKHGADDTHPEPVGLV